MKTFSRKKQLLVGFTLFSMFFGAGNLIFPPYLGMQAGTNFWLAFLGLSVSAVALPIAGVIAAAHAGGLMNLASSVHPKFALIFTIAVYLAIGPCLAIPRTASTSFEMLVPLVQDGRNFQAAYSAVFFAAAFLLALRPEKLTDRLGKILCPCLLVLILVLFAGCLFHPLSAAPGVPATEYATLPAARGILYGYQTMDTLAALNFGAVILLNIAALGITERQEQERSAVRAGWIAGCLLLAVYAMLGYAGTQVGGAFSGLDTGAEVLTALANALFGTAGLSLVAAIFLIACFNTCVGLLACVGQYFHELLPRIPYPAMMGFFAFASMLISNIGLAQIIQLSTPVLNAVYPIAIVLILLFYLPRQKQQRVLPRLCVGFTAVQSILAAFPLGILSRMANSLPLASFGFGWMVPALLGFALGWIADGRK